MRSCQGKLDILQNLHPVSAKLKTYLMCTISKDVRKTYKFLCVQKSRLLTHNFNSKPKCQRVNFNTKESQCHLLEPS